MSEVDQTPISPAGQQPQDIVSQAALQSLQQVQSASTPPGQSQVNSAGEQLQCQWQGCGERATSAEALYDHVCERHVGRKSTNNLNLTCAWGQCRTTTVKRDHITSHIRVHVPLKPHKCEFCGKAFKRPQDLKKHVKTHADDSVINMRSPEPNGASRNAAAMSQGGSYNPYTGQGLTGQAPSSYYGPAVSNDTYQPAHQYYQPQQTGQHPGYGPVTYYNAPAPQATYDYETRKRGYDALDAFFGQVKSRGFDPVNFADVSRRLYELQGLQLPQIIPSTVGVPAYQPVAAVGSRYEAADPIQAYSLPPMSNAKTRGDLTSIDQILEQMQATIYENDSSQLSQTGISHPGTSYVTYRTSNSPPAVGHPQHQHNTSISEHASTPGLTPPSSAHSYTSGQSPLPGHADPANGQMYPNLPSNADLASYAASAATLSMNDYDARRHYGGGTLRRAAPAKDEVAELIDRDGSATPPAAAINAKVADKGKKAASPSDVIDPALGEAAASKEDKGEPDREQVWVQNMRLIEWMRDYIKKAIDRGEYEDAETTKTETEETKPDVEMTGTDEDDQQRKKDEEQLYPVLQAMNDEST